jgi:hypothetical protein
MGIVDNFKDLFKVAESVNNLDLYKKLSELQTRVMEVEEENRGLKDRVGQLIGQLSTRDSLVHDGERYWSQRDGKRDGPFCSTCWDVDSRLVRMRTYQSYGTGRTAYTCDYCGRHRGKPVS